jgi:hypothetical protein
MVVVICYTKIQLFFIPTTIYIEKDMNAFFVGVTPEEKENILSKHRHVYNGYRTLNPSPVANEQPLYTQDFANDKEGLVVNNKGEVKAYTNMGINEAKKRKSYVEMEEEMCEQCGGKMNEGMCEQCSSNESLEEDMIEDLDIGDVASSVEPAYQFQSHGPEDVYGTLDDYDSEHPHHDYNSMEDVEKYDPSDDLSDMFGNLSDGMAFGGGPSDTFQHDAGDVNRMGDEGLGQDTENDMDLSSIKSPYNFTSDGFEDGDDDSEFNVEEEVDEDLQESFTKERKLTLEMFQRMSKFL